DAAVDDIVDRKRCPGHLHRRAVNHVRQTRCGKRWSGDEEQGKHNGWARHVAPVKCNATANGTGGRCRLQPAFRPAKAGRYITAIKSISSAAPFGNPATCTVVRAGLWSPKYSA